TGAEALVFPSLYEGFGLPAIEAMACGTPVLTSNTSSMPEVAGDAALLVDPLDTAAIAAGIERIATDQALRAMLRERGLAHAATFTWRRAAEQTLAVLEEVGNEA
ncbi:MAG TPA: glycosyltransferase family 1 protein, partial [Nitrolancea sp.]|nr:glycosyltransferase family 1 protein [Nitrolancea sp.]